MYILYMYGWMDAFMALNIQEISCTYYIHRGPVSCVHICSMYKKLEDPLLVYLVLYICIVLLYKVEICIFLERNSSVLQYLQALSVGIFPYVLKLLQSNARELRPLLVFIWAKILSVDSVSSISLVTFRGWLVV